MYYAYNWQSYDTYLQQSLTITAEDTKSQDLIRKDQNSMPVVPYRLDTFTNPKGRFKQRTTKKFV